MSIFDAAKFLIALYKKTEYKCDRRKLQKLIIYADFIHFATKGSRLLAETTVTASERGLSLDDLVDSIYTLTINLINSRVVIDQEFDIEKLHEGLNPALYYELDENEMAYLIYVFRQFGAYSGDDLTAMSKETDIWKLARENKSPKEKCFVTTDIYKKVIEEKIPITAEDRVDTDANIKNKVINYLQEKLKEADEDGKNYPWKNLNHLMQNS